MPDGRDNFTVIGADAVFKGELSFDGSAKILGTFEGAIAASGTVQVEAGAKVRAKLEASVIIVDGEVEGDLTASERLQLASHANVRGDITTKALAVSEGASFLGYCAVGPEALNAPRPERASERFAFSSSKPMSTRVARPKPEQDWIAEGKAAPNSSLASATVNSKPAWMTGADEKAD